MKRITEEIPSGYPRYYLNNPKRPTFAGVLEANFYKRNDFNYYISQNWTTTRTIEDAIEDYCNSILPRIRDRDKPLDAYEEKDFLDLLEELKKGKGFDEKRENRLRFLIWRVYLAAIENIPGFVPRFRWDKDEKGLNSFKEDYSDSSDEVVRIMMMPKSFTVEQELKILRAFRAEDITTMDGVRLGLFLMFFLGARNEEACGLSWDDIVSPFPERPEKKAIVIHTSFKGGVLRTTLKRKNSYRILPLIPFLMQKLETRRKHIMGILGEVSGDKIPVACIGDDYRKRVRPEDLTAYGRKFIREEIGEPSKISAISEMISMLESQNVQIGEKEPTSYLMRRAFGTHLRNIGFEAEEIEFLMGHFIENETVKRYHMAATDSLQRIFDMFEAHPFNAFFCGKPTESQSQDNSPVSNLIRKRRFVIEANEPCDPIEIEIPEDASGVEIVCSTTVSKYGNAVDISGIINPKYQADSKHSIL